MSKDNRGNFVDDGLYKFMIVKGNNSALVRRVLETRTNWSEMSSQGGTLFSFKWCPVSKYCNFDILSSHGAKNSVNKFERHDQLTTKDSLYLNMQRYCELNKLDIFKYLPIQFVFDFYNYNFTHEIEKFVTYFKSIEKVKQKESNK